MTTSDGDTIYGWTVDADAGSIRLRFTDINGDGESYWMEPDDAIDIGKALIGKSLLSGGKG